MYSSFRGEESMVVPVDFEGWNASIGVNRLLDRPLPGLPAKVVPRMALGQLATSCRSEVGFTPEMRKSLSEALRSGGEGECLIRVNQASIQDLNRTDNTGSTPLHHSVRRRMLEVSRAILARPDFEALQEWDSRGDTVLHCAVKQADAAACCLILAKDATMALAENSSGQTAAEVAMRSGDRSIISAFQECRARR
mmetsp:Transcript_26337/g.62790  ORF Transcript_26337/g.62790 Transcript_26337/m.62790 type:complete len:195 (+) Transcript_26337:84-668(+)|eukprot:CAMPEP_0181411518 /NCGR_PEP_ID=MMETSP1110-20121109/7920_1 /TAXON_ID=174948 /ORGANISM="Symbiodinium sp., Strain CCMP421" /LENGTH=194 /DNA_ID=CAMNT_0023534147 /DNA_START=84 /DNA_END=668 /DNA_ORIENTATION=-